MSWAARRRFVVFSIVAAFIIASIATFFVSALYKAPSCGDGIQNQMETGIDCGGPCSYLCTNQQHTPTVLFTKAIWNGTGRVDIVASIENTNSTAAAKSVPYTITLYGSRRTVIQQITGTIDLPPASTVPVYISGISVGTEKTVRAFLAIDDSSPWWFTMARDTRIKPVVTNTAIGGSNSVPRIDAVLSNSSVTPLTNVRVVIFVRDAKGEVMAASQTVIPTIPAQGQSTATFTWNSAFQRPPVIIEVLPIIPLP